jgi:competence protein ComEC
VRSKENKIFTKLNAKIAVALLIYFVLIGLAPKFVGSATMLGAIGLFVYLFFKNDKFKQKTKKTKGIVAIGLLFMLSFGSTLTTAATGNPGQSSLTPDKAKVESQAKIEAENKTKEEQVKKEAEVKAKQEEAKQEDSKKAEEQQAPAVAVAPKEQATTVNGDLKVHFIDVGQADSILVQQGNSTMLIDAGNDEDNQIIKRYLDSQGIKQLDVVVGTHAHEDHIGSMSYIINAFKVVKVYFPKQTANTNVFKDFVNSVKGKGLQLTTPVVGESFKIGDATATILAPNGSGYEDANDYSVVLKLTYGSNSFLLTGDAEAVSESEMLAKGTDLSATVLKVGHHGSKSSTSQSFLNKVNPKHAVISVGKGNSYGHPTQEVMNRLKAKGVTTYRTDESGTVVATSNGNNITFSTNPGSYNGVSSSASSNNTGSSGSSSTGGSGNAPTSQPAPTPTPTPAPAPTNNARTVFFTKSGKSYHYDQNCRAFKSNSIVLSGPLSQAISGGHSDPCDFCVPQ